MTVEKKYPGHPDLTGGGQTTLHSHAGGGGEAFPIGSIFISVVSTNPNTLLGYGTWVAFAAGKVLIGLDSGDADFDTVKETGGQKTIDLAHTHDSHSIAGSRTGNPSADYLNGPETHSSELSNVQSVMNPYIVVYIWERTA